jgi:hypothetical protein
VLLLAWLASWSSAADARTFRPAVQQGEASDPFLNRSEYEPPLYQASRPVDPNQIIRLAPTGGAPTAAQPSNVALSNLVQPLVDPQPLAETLPDLGVPQARDAELLLPPASPRRGLPDWFYIDAVARGYYTNDQRLEWSGQEATFGAEAAIAPLIQKRFNTWELSAEGDFYLNQRFDKNILVDSPERMSFQANFEDDIFEISNLLLSARHGSMFFALGKMETPFGRYYAPLLSNARFDAPFLRTEAINWRETGFLFRYEKSCWIGEVALTNGSEDRDTNSSKALVARVGLQGENFALGGSVKVQDGIGSEGQKYYDNHFGVDFMFRRGRFILAGEAIYDEYGFRQDVFDPQDIFWGRSIYYRDLFYAAGEPINGIGYYVQAGMEFDRWSLWLNYGEFYPKEIGNVMHDQVNRRGIVKSIVQIAPHFDWYGVAIIENEGYPAQGARNRKGNAVLTGFQASF